MAGRVVQGFFKSVGGRAVAHEVTPPRIAGRGAPLPPDLRKRMERALGADFASVRVHVDASATRMGALAYASGEDVVFAPGQYGPHSAQWLYLLGHELAHVVQQRQGRVRGVAGGTVVVTDPALEREADAMGARAAAGGVAAGGPLAHPAGMRAARAGGVIQRRAVGNGEIKDFLAGTPQRNDELRGAYVSRVTAAFRAANQYAQPDDVAALRTQAWGVTETMPPAPAAIMLPLAADFDRHILGDMPGVGWHLELTHRNGDMNTAANPPCETHSYVNRRVLASSKGTYVADRLRICEVLKTGNGSTGTFFDARTSLADIRHDALYVANSYPQRGQLVIGRGQRTGVVIECIIRNNRVESAYPYM